MSMELCLTTFLSVVGSHKDRLYLDTYCFSFILMTYKSVSSHHLYLCMLISDTSLTLSANGPTTLEEKLNKSRDKVQSNKPTLSDNKNLR